MNEIKKYIFSTNNEWIKYADQKATILISVYGILITIIYTNPQEVLKSINHNLLTQIIFGLTLLVVALSIYNAFRAMYPRIDNNNPDTVLFFGHISKLKTWQEYKTKFENDKENLEDQILEQIHTNADICSKKFNNVKWSVRLFGIAMTLILIQIGIYLFI